MTSLVSPLVLCNHTYTLDPTESEWADYAAVQAECGNLSRNELTSNSSGNTRSQLSQLAEPLWTDPGLKKGISLCELISTLKKRKVQAGNKLLNIFQKSSHARKKPPPPPPPPPQCREGQLCVLVCVCIQVAWIIIYTSSTVQLH